MACTVHFTSIWKGATKSVCVSKYELQRAGVSAAPRDPASCPIRQGLVSQPDHHLFVTQWEGQVSPVC